MKPPVVSSAGLLTAGLALLGAGLQHSALARGMVVPVYHPPPSCTDGECKGDDPRNALPCQGFLCSFSSSKSLQPPVTAAQAEAAARAKATAAQTAVAPPPPADPAPRAKHKHAKIKSPTPPAAAETASTK